MRFDSAERVDILIAVDSPHLRTGSRMVGEAANSQVIVVTGRNFLQPLWSINSVGAAPLTISAVDIRTSYTASPV